ncbi:transglutaminase-like domain-containing protein [Microbacterium sp. ASV49]|uniref:Transglutaminase-like domain-containing protein n=1 Tax=Microbacterium candidum TaxID=3041922 RepID=A0ABT7MUS3_9MICO|nr:transglutaminase-like domain-containing protein [Microbacterium sp. ASV49]MDL9978200.1 transglutaminase-like domain-containing protein [Microbacterium sp. ASV49]
MTATSTDAPTRARRARSAAPARRAAEPLSARRWALDLSASALLLAVPIAGFWTTFGGPAYLPAAVGAAVLGLAIAALGARFRWGVLLVAAATVVVYFVFGALALPATALAGVIPTLDTFRGLAIGAVESFKILLTTPLPVPATDGFLVVPYLLSLVAAVLVGSLGLRLRTPAWALIPASAYLAAGIALGASEPAFPIAQGVVFGVVAISWLAIRQAWAPSAVAAAISADGAPTRVGAGRRIAAGAGILAIALGSGVAAGAIAPAPTTRYVLRDVVIPPFDVHQYASPLQSYRSYVRDYTKEPLFTVSGLPKGARVRIAAMDAYSGTVYDVSSAGAGSSSAFIPMRSDMSGSAAGTPATVKVTIDGYSGVWMPGVGAAQSITFQGPNADALRRAAYYNASTQTAVDTTPLHKGDAYEIDAVVPSVPSDASLAKTPFAPVTLPKQQGVPQAFADLANKAVGDASTPIAQVRALQKHFAEGGYFSDGLEGQPRSLAGHGAGRISAMLGADQMVGDDEQYAVAMALFARELGIPARVVLGFHAPKDAAASGVFKADSDTLHAWVEVAFQGVGWVPFDPTPDKDRVPTQETTKPKQQPKPQVLQPPPPAQKPADEPPSIPDDRGKDNKNNTLPGWIGTALTVGGSTLAVIAVLLAPFVAMGIVKGTRRRRRKDAARPSDRISGGWDELMDRALDLGTPLASGATRGEDAATVASAFDQPAVATLARQADAQVFGPSEPTPDDIARFWGEVDEIVGGMTAQRSFWRRLGARLSIRSLRSGRRPASTDTTPPPPGTVPKERP